MSKPPHPAPACGTCKWWTADAHDAPSGYGTCHALPPTTVEVPAASRPLHAHPVTHETDDGCALHEV